MCCVKSHAKLKHPAFSGQIIPKRNKRSFDMSAHAESRKVHQFWKLIHLKTIRICLGNRKGAAHHAPWQNMRGCHVWNYFLTEHCTQMFWETGRGQHTMHHDRIWGDVKYETLLNRTCKFVFWETGRGRHALQLRKLNGVQFGNYFYMTHVPRLFGNRKGAAWGSMCCSIWKFRFAQSMSRFFWETEGVGYNSERSKKGAFFLGSRSLSFSATCWSNPLYKW